MQLAQGTHSLSSYIDEAEDLELIWHQVLGQIKFHGVRSLMREDWIELIEGDIAYLAVSSIQYARLNLSHIEVAFEAVFLRPILVRLITWEDVYDWDRGVALGMGGGGSYAENYCDTYAPDFVSPPGETLAEILEERGITRSQFGEMLRWDVEDVEQVIEGKKMIDGEIALAFESVLGISSIFWLNREKNYRDCLKA